MTSKPFNQLCTCYQIASFKVVTFCYALCEVFLYICIGDYPVYEEDHYVQHDYEMDNKSKYNINDYNNAIQLTYINL